MSFFLIQFFNQMSHEMRHKQNLVKIQRAFFELLSLFDVVKRNYIFSEE
jgi:hypothetical protein